MSNNKIIPAQTAIETFRYAGYKSTASAVAELIDNSIEAGADDIQILTFEEFQKVSKRQSKRINRLALYDNGGGMSPEVLAMCLQFGNGTRLTSRSGIGRFGIGLPNASVSQCRRVDVYSWQNNSCHHTYLDIDQIKDEGLEEVRSVDNANLPADVKKAILGKLGPNGTVILWSKCDRLDIAKSKTLFNEMNHDLCRIYRHYLDDDDTYGKKRNIRLIIADHDVEFCKELQANDPLYLMTPSNTPDYENMASNALYGEIEKLFIDYDDEGNKALVELRFTIAKPETQALGGGSQLGLHYRDNTGISFIRAAREIDFGTFGYFNPRDERERWWGCEIRFEPILDEVFGVTNNKQAVRGIDYVDLDAFKKLHGDDFDDLIEDDLKLKLRIELSRVFSQFHSKAMDIIKSRGAGKRGGTAEEKAQSDKSTKIANEVLPSPSTDSKSAIEGGGKSDEQAQDEWVNTLTKGDTSLDPKIAEKIAGEKSHLKIDKEFSEWPGSQFFTVDTIGKTAVITINRKHPFFTDMYDPLLSTGDDKYIEALDLLLMSYAWVENEMYSRIDDLDIIRDTWGRHLRDLLKKLHESA